MTNIGKQAFYDCAGLSSVQFPRGLKTIGDYAFSNTSSLTNIFLPAHVEMVGDDIFGAKKDNATYYAPVTLRAGGKLNKYDPIYYGYGSEEGYGTLAFDEHETFKVVAFRLLGPNEFFFTIEGTPKEGAKAENLMAQQLGVLRDKTLGSLATAPFGIDDIRDFVAEDLPGGRIRASFRLVIPESEVSDLMFFKVAAENPD